MSSPRPDPRAIAWERSAPRKSSAITVLSTAAASVQRGSAWVVLVISIDALVRDAWSLGKRIAIGAHRMTAPFPAPDSPAWRYTCSPASDHGTPAARRAIEARVVLPMSLGSLCIHSTKRRETSSTSIVPVSARLRAIASVICVSSVISPGARSSQPPPVKSRMPSGCSLSSRSRLRNSNGPPSASPQAKPIKQPRYRSSSDDSIAIPRTGAGIPSARPTRHRPTPGFRLDSTQRPYADRAMPPDRPRLGLRESPLRR